MELGSIVRDLESKAILVTGATGFLAKVFVEKILRVQPNVKKLYLLLRAPDTKTAVDHLHNEVIGKDLFNVLREKLGTTSLYSLVSEKVIPIPGDISEEDLDLKDTNLKEEMWREIDTVVNFAASTNFNERYDISLGINTFGALHVLNLSKRCVKIKILVHVSTAYVCGEDEGLILERAFSMGKAKSGITKIDIDGEKNMVQQKLYELNSQHVSKEAITSAMKDFGIQRARLHGWPNTYVFTKAMGEMFLLHIEQNIPALIFRPTIVESTLHDPFPGLIEGLRTIDSVIGGYATGKIKCFISNSKSTADVIPADMVVNAIIVGMVAQYSNQPLEGVIYHVGSSLRNPTYFSNLHDFSFRYFTHSPFIPKDDAKPLKIGKIKTFSSMRSFRIYAFFNFLLPLKVLCFVNTLSFQKYKETYAKYDRNIKLMMRLVDLYRPYVFFKGIFDSSNTEKLQMVAKERYVDAEAFMFDPKAIDWEDYMLNAHLPGLINHVMKKAY